MSIVHQNETWTTKCGETIRLDDMSKRHLSNVLAMLRRTAGAIKFFDDMALCFLQMPNIETCAYDSVHDAIGQQFDMSAADWIETTPLVQRLRVLTEEESEHANVPRDF
jgi:hypothetical protein